ncbi:MAG: hypothetical protein CR997_03175 [Acidobacteria bacterium]|nr:MAG: hypothetical protein CR997_03175 [Acidobacteriota bacterium]
MLGGIVKKQLNTLIFILLTALLFWGCSDSDDNHEAGEYTPYVSETIAKFDPSTGNPADIPIPNNILRNPMTGQVAIPNSAESQLIADVNTLHGFSTTAPIFVPFVGPVDASTVNEETLMVLDVSTFKPAAVSYEVLTHPESGDSTVIMKPILPLKPSTTYSVIVTPFVKGMDGLSVQSTGLLTLLKSGASFVDENGHSTQASLDDATAAALEPLRQAYQGVWKRAETAIGVGRYQLSVVFEFTTQPLLSTLQAMRTTVQGLEPTPTILQALPTPEAVDAFFNSIGLGAAPHNAIGAMYYGSFEAPNYLQQHPAGLGPVGPFVVENGQLQQLGTSHITFWAALPVGAQGPVPVMIFQHGITRMKEDMFAIANTANSLGVGMIGIDIVLHGDRSSDFFNNETGEFGPDGVPDPSGTGFINLLHPLMSRDAGRQTVSDLFTLTRMITSGATDFNADGTPEFAPGGITYTGISLGGIIGSVFTGLEPDVSLACFSVPGGRMSNLLINSVSLSASINPALQAAGIMPGTPQYFQFWMLFQTAVDNADPINYAPYLSSGVLAGDVPTTVLVQEMQNDLVVPNVATQDLVRAMGIPQVSAKWEYPGMEQVDAPYTGSGLFQYTDGGHGFLLDPSQGPTVQAQTQAMTFLLQGIQGNPVIIDPFAAKAKATVTPHLMSRQFQMNMNFDFLFKSFQ